MQYKNITAVLTTIFCFMVATPAVAVTLQLDPSATYLRTNENVHWGLPKSATAYSLADFGFAAGDTILLTRLGTYMSTYASWGGTDTSSSLLAVFSSNSFLFDAINPSTDPNAFVQTPAVRLTGAIATDLPSVVSRPAYHGLLPSDPKSTLPTDIPEDFSVSKIGTVVTIPTGAQYIFFSANDTMIGDDRDPDNNFGVSITAVPEPATWLLMLLGLTFTGFAAQRNKR